MCVCACVRACVCVCVFVCVRGGGGGITRDSTRRRHSLQCFRRCELRRVRVHAAVSPAPTCRQRRKRHGVHRHVLLVRVHCNLKREVLRRLRCTAECGAKAQVARRPSNGHASLHPHGLLSALREQQSGSVWWRRLHHSSHLCCRSRLLDGWERSKGGARLQHNVGWCGHLVRCDGRVPRWRIRARATSRTHSVVLDVCSIRAHTTHKFAR
jgi:hypothetical protein